MAVVSLVVFNYPNSNVYLIFLPFIPIPSTYVSICVCERERERELSDY